MVGQREHDEAWQTCTRRYVSTRFNTLISLSSLARCGIEDLGSRMMSPEGALQNLSPPPFPSPALEHWGHVGNVMSRPNPHIFC